MFRSEKIIYPFDQANKILPTMPVPSFIIHVMAAETGVAVSDPTPTPCMIACIVNVPDMELQNAWQVSQI